MAKLAKKSLTVGSVINSIEWFDGKPYRKVPCKVCGIRTDCDSPSILTDRSDVWYDISSFEGIPFTKEIMENSGFEEYAEGYVYTSKYREKVVFDTNTNKLKVLVDYDTVFKLRFPDKPQVHEVQQLLDLLGIGLEIKV